MTGPGPFGRHPDAVDSVAGVNEPPTVARRPGRLRSLPWWVVFLLGFLYFFLPLLGTFAFSMRAQPLFSAYAIVTDDPEFFATLLYSFVVGLVTIIVSTALIVPTPSKCSARSAGTVSMLWFHVPSEACSMANISAGRCVKGRNESRSAD